MLKKYLSAAENHAVDFHDLLSVINRHIKSFHLMEHCHNVAKLSYIIATEMGLSPLERSIAYWEGLLHDGGKYFLPDEIILSPKKVTNIQYNMIKTHALLSASMLRGIKLFNQTILVNGKPVNIAQDIKDHHERIDGRGYQLKPKEKVSLYAQIVSVADTFDAMSTHVRKFNNQSRKLEFILDIMQKESGKQLHQGACEAFLNYAKKISAQSSKDIIYSPYEEDDLHKIFEINGGAKATIDTFEILNFFEKVIDRNRKFTALIDGVPFLIREASQEYIIGQDGEPAVRKIFQIDGKKKIIKAKVAQEKRIFSLEEISLFLNLAPESAKHELKKMNAFIQKTGTSYKLITLHHSADDFKFILNEYGTLAESDLASLDGLLTEKTLNTQNVISRLTEQKFLDSGGVILKVPAHESELGFGNGIDKSVFEKLHDRYVKDLADKRHKIFELWDRTKQETITTIKNQLTEDQTKQIWPLLDYLQRLNQRGIPVIKMKKVFRLVAAEFNISKERLKFLEQTLILHHIFSNIFFLDEKHEVETRQTVEENITELINKARDFKRHYAFFTPHVDLLIEKYLYRIKDNKELTKANSEEVFLLDLVDKFISSNGNLSWIEESTPQIENERKNRFFKALSTRPNLVNPLMRKYLKG